MEKGVAGGGSLITTLSTLAGSIEFAFTVVFGNSVVYIGDAAFRNNKLTNVSIGNFVMSIGKEAFYNNY